MTPTSERHILITGASSGIGRATALAFAAEGYPVALVGRSPDKLAALAELIQAQGGHAVVYALDLAKIDQVRTQVTAIAAAFAPVDVLINCAGMGYTASLLDTPLRDWQQVIDLNLTSVFQCIQGVLPSMRGRHQGTIINVISIAGKQTFPEWGAYCVSKFGLMALSKTLAMEERSHGIRIVALCPGAVNTPLWDAEAVNADFDRTAMLSPEVVAQSILYTALLPSQAVVEELTLMPHTGTF
ncbi:short-chain dehydrogenase [Neosynechococcus sphagnicola sy1]|uniref:Short-chain dehydrogenase n=2 Tax=Neosynechococcus TaxID=1501143 RepID=A0A098TMV5_9CYAN|nr:SDR family oxidoreductase [Neosynechococcus sphagnicola]KGF72183.1 short-chain dehydrogenase [Neosynechococcus sphagnicola sy1]